MSLDHRLALGNRHGEHRRQTNAHKLPGDKIQRHRHAIGEKLPRITHNAGGHLMLVVGVLIHKSQSIALGKEKGGGTFLSMSALHIFLSAPAMIHLVAAFQITHLHLHKRTPLARLQNGVLQNQPVFTLMLNNMTGANSNSGDFHGVVIASCCHRDNKEI